MIDIIDTNVAGKTVEPTVRPVRKNHTVSCMYNSKNERIPCIRLSGKWLRNAGFEIGDKVFVTVNHNNIVIEKSATK